MVVYDDNSVLVYSKNEYSYSYNLGSDQRILSNHNGDVEDYEIDLDYSQNLEYGEPLIFNPIITPNSDVYELSYDSAFNYFEYYNRITSVNRYVKLTSGKGNLSYSSYSHARSTSSSSKQHFEDLSELYLGYIINNIDLANPDFISDLFEKSNLYYPGFSVTEKNDVVDLYAEVVENGYNVTTATIASAITTAILNKIGQGFATTTAGFVQAGFRVSSYPAIIANYNNLEYVYNRFVNE